MLLSNYFPEINALIGNTKDFKVYAVSLGDTLAKARFPEQTNENGITEFLHRDFS